MAVLRGAPAAQRIAGCDGERVEACSPLLCCKQRFRNGSADDCLGIQLS
jgi:hypothetical protein